MTKREKLMGKVHIYYGNGKGKTTAAAGLAIRFSATGGKTVFCQFLKNGTSGEIGVLSEIKNTECLFCEENFGFTWEMSPQQRKKAGQVYLELLKNAADRCGENGMLVLDELLDVVSAGLIEEEKVYNIICNIKNNTEIIITGHSVCDKLFSVGDYITCMKKEKHPFDCGLQARKGIEY